MHMTLSPCRAKNRGEQTLASQLEALECPTFRLCFSLGLLPGVREIDLLLVDMELGCYLIEIKAVTLDIIKSVAPNEWHIQGRSSTESPLLQAYSQYEGLAQFWNTRMQTRLPFIAITACFPRISRQEWLDAFPPGSYAQSITDGLIFRDDLLSSTALRDHLRRVMEKPAIRSGHAPYRVSKTFVAELGRFLAAAQPQQPTDNDRHRLRAIENGVRKGLEKEFPVESRQFALFSGHPGTGKTFRLLSIGFLHATRKRRVLFACFNKTLASDIRRLVGFSEGLNATGRGLVCADVFQLAIGIHKMNGLPYRPGLTPDEWGASVVTWLKHHPEALRWRIDTLLVDESHDMQDWHLELLEHLLAPNASIYIAMGPGQSLYRTDSGALQWLKTLGGTRPIREKRLRRNFRNTPLQYAAALAFHKAWPDRLVQVRKTFDSVTRPDARNEEFDFERQGAALDYAPVPALDHEFDDDGSRQDELVSAVYADLIGAELAQLLASSGGAAINMLLLVPSENGSSVRWVRKALVQVLARLPEASFIDYVEESNRRTLALSHEIRLSTFHSSRGLEGERVMIFGLEEIQQVALKAQALPENLGFICLSRGIFRTTVVARNYYRTPVHSLIEEVLKVGTAMPLIEPSAQIIQRQQRDVRKILFT